MVHFDDRGASLPQVSDAFSRRFSRTSFDEQNPNEIWSAGEVFGAAERKLQIAQIVRSQLNGGSRLAELEEVPASR